MSSRSQNIDTLLRTIYGEARGEGRPGMIAVANVVMNRLNSDVTWWGTDVYSICRKPWQFSCWNQNDPNRQLIQNLSSGVLYDMCKEIATMAVDNELPDTTNGATSYYAESMPEPPKWAIGMTPCAKIGHQLFFREANTGPPEKVTPPIIS